ncbi:uncharacterized protein EKO05_0001950 [Ascochyta rabiei]|uniref:Metal ion transmembrane transporter n=1 Tax=Didymella rabiei TaxID=5454 RepID=A0A163I6F9_DIDRA|nr:uncharacterized protein EKO05_0001950 [Ascochyta rabiei]KZM25629.1 metal ion transmembrane transporter [Ascochyta rabiei]UPX11344.1 hypothetical protein EKO05_0001950 [Ascochyta rabiei]
MEGPRATSSVVKGINFAWQEGYKDVDDSELETLLAVSREFVCSLETELQARRLSTRPEPSKAVSDCINKLQRRIKDWNILQRLNKKETDLVHAASDALTIEQSTRDGALYQAFLRDVHRTGNRTLVLLCAASLGKQRVISLNARERTDLLQILKLTRDALAVPALDSLAQDLLPQDIGTPSVQSCKILLMKLTHKS